jgi:hypothetical protein
VRVQTDDGAGGTFAKAFTITVADVNENSYTIGGSTSGLAGSGLVLQNNGGDNRSITANVTYTFATPILSGQLKNNGADQTTINANGSFTFGTAIAGGQTYTVGGGCGVHAVERRPEPAWQRCCRRVSVGD